MCLQIRTAQNNYRPLFGNIHLDIISHSTRPSAYTSAANSILLSVLVLSLDGSNNSGAK